ncbi:PaaX family transcriptional regulator C-terminal domain-containing protein [Paracoccus sp. TOH]|uniref:PaaX family transcriptional regulator C-terminal domain-containing protein n=1 Tax=Paracoccus simplex TaxID=2086346 RepID=A0ABV7RZ47_9RHOB|nr:PaaX family transcriptional regulator C-terminal domain-containing protein [Paracoccus sp. TOH]WJS87060.1 PaaX family transcriptional regulator [Paracoccus sp. TOH]
MFDGNLLAGILRGLELRSASFIVTVYGDVVVPRGGVLWTGTLIEICARVGISESLVRTAVSRLVAAHRLRGERAGRRSYYRLDASARKEFDQAARLLYAPDPVSEGWQIIHAPAMTEDQARHLRLGRMGGTVFIRPDRGQEPPEGAVVFQARDPEAAAELARYWDLSALQGRYLEMLGRFGDVLEPARRGALPDETALVVRLLLVEVYRKVLLRDPRLPARVLPPDWRGGAARDLFRRLYAALSPAAERHIASRFEGVDGFLPARTAESANRMDGML